MDTDECNPVVLAQEAFFRFTDRGEPCDREQFESGKPVMQKALGSFCGKLAIDGPEGAWDALAELDDATVAQVVAATVANLEGDVLRYVALIGLLKLAEVVEAAESG